MEQFTFIKDLDAQGKEITAKIKAKGIDIEGVAISDDFCTVIINRNLTATEKTEIETITGKKFKEKKL